MLVIIIYLTVWVYFLTVFHRADAQAWKFIWGSLGIFIFLLVWVDPIIQNGITQCISAIASIFGNVTGIYKVYLDYSSIFVQSEVGSVLLQIDVECSGSIEMSVYLALITFFNAYKTPEKILAALSGIMYLIMANSLRVILISLSVYLFGYGVYDIVHSYIAKFLFYILSVLLYFNVFTRAQIKRMKVGDFSYDK